MRASWTISSTCVDSRARRYEGGLRRRHATPRHEPTGRGEDTGERDDQARSRRERCRQGHGHDAHQGGGPDRLPHPQLTVDEGVDVVHDGGEHVAAAGAEPARDQRDQGVVDLGAPLGEEPERGGVAGETIRSAYRRVGRPRPKVRTPTIATIR